MEKKLRCAIYTRKSSEEGLEQGFNSLHAQREACEAYILSQAGEGWSALPILYDDGGFSGGSMERPALKVLLADIAGGKIDVVVVYKVDRLTRSLTDFAKIVDAFDQHHVSFVSVTQAFNTTTSMGRLTLNVLLSFAQFEREVTGERIRDKILASKKKGMWMGGNPPIGYDTPKGSVDRALVVNDAEAKTVRLIFERYLELQSVRDLKHWTDAEGISSKAWVTRQGRARGGVPFDRGALFHLLKNRTYIGEIPHKNLSYLGAHKAIVDKAVFERVQEGLAAKATRHHQRPRRSSTLLLKGLIFDADGAAMSPTFTHNRHGKLYRYYVSTSRHNGMSRPTNRSVHRVAADLIEPLITDCVDEASAGLVENVQAAIRRVEVHEATVQIELYRGALFKRRSDPDAELDSLRRRLPVSQRAAALVGDVDAVRVTIPFRLKTQGGRCWMVDGAGKAIFNKTTPDVTLIGALHKAHRLIVGDRSTAVERIMIEAAPPRAYDRAVSRLAFLAPDVQAAILEGRQRSDLTLAALIDGDIPAAWVDQRRLFGVDH